MSTLLPVPDLSSLYSTPLAPPEVSPPYTPPKHSKPPQNAFSPIRPRIYAVIPGTPGLKKVQIRALHSPKKKFFKGEEQKVTLCEFGRRLVLHSIPGCTAYKLSDKTLSIVKQTGKKTCGPTCAMMLALDQLAKKTEAAAAAASSREADLPPAAATVAHEERELFSESFFTWFHCSSLSRGDDLMVHLREEGYNPVTITFSKEDPSSKPSKERETIHFENGDDIINSLSQKIKETGNSIIVAIFHPIIAGHWIIVDSISLDQNEKPEFCHIRDPFTGKAYKLPINELSKLINDGCSRIEAVYLQN